MSPPIGQPSPRVAIACGGTGGHLFPGLAIAGELRQAGCDVTLLVSDKEIDRLALKGSGEVKAVALPAVGLSSGREFAFLRGFAAAYRTAARLFRRAPPDAVISMGGFTGAPPVLAGRRRGARVFLHESNSIPGKANRWISWVADRSFVGFAGAAARLHSSKVVVTGTPVRPSFVPAPAEDCRRELGLDPMRPVLLVTGGSQGASALNKLITGALPALRDMSGGPQLLWLTGMADAESARAACARTGVPAQVHAFFDRMETALGSATVAISRAGASSLAEFAAVRVPAILIPYPSAADQHQLHNARACLESGTALLCEQATTSSEKLASLISELLAVPSRLEAMKASLARWHTPDAASRIAILKQ